MFKKPRERQEFYEDGSYAKYEREEVNRRRLLEGREGEPPKVFIAPKSWVASAGLLFFYTGFLSVTVTYCFISMLHF